jgi:branched-chain amino acid transport system ATP-binding protein
MLNDSIITNDEPLLIAENLTISFGGLMALSQVSFKAHLGKILSIIGPNGSGKTTLINLCTGYYLPDFGKVIYGGKIINALKPHQISGLGISRTFQHLKIFNKLTVLENVVVGGHCKGKSGFFSCALSLPKSRQESEKSFEEAEIYLKFVGLEDHAREYPQNLPFGKQKLLEISRGLISKPKLFVLDEPAAGLNSQEKVILGQMICKIRDTGICIILIEHDMDLVMGISDSIIVLNYGIKIAEGNPMEVRSNPDVVNAYLGKGVDFA